MKIFDKDSRKLFDKLKGNVEYEINRDNLLNFECEEYINGLNEKFKIVFSCILNINEMSRGDIVEFSKGYVDHFERNYDLKMIKCKFYIPVTGENLTILEYKGWSQQTLRYDILEDTTFNEETEVLEITVEKPVESNTNLKTEVDKIINEINRRLPWLIKDIDDYNKQLIDFIKQNFKVRINQLNKIKQSDEEIGLPLYVPIKREIIEIRKETIPVSSRTSVNASEIEKHYLDEKSFKQINAFIHSFAKSIESYPKSYSEASEEMIRDQLLVTLNQVMSNESSVTGETFNKVGKTDIMIRYKNDIIFVAECKKWAGYLSFKNAIDQLRSYLTWRNNRASVIVFSHKKNFNLVLKEIEENILNYPNLVNKTVKFDSDGILTVDINDGEKFLKMTVQAFNLYSDK